jgi:hypothetical protein
MAKMQALNTSSSVIGACTQQREEVSWLREERRPQDLTCRKVVTDSLPHEEFAVDIDIIGPVGHERKCSGGDHDI